MVACNVKTEKLEVICQNRATRGYITINSNMNSLHREQFFCRNISVLYPMHKNVIFTLSKNHLPKIWTFGNCLKKMIFEKMTEILAKKQ